MSGKIRVLVVEDSPVVRLLLATVLARDPGLEVAGVCADGAAAVAHVAVNPPDVVLMDVNMPVMDGFEATRRIMEATPVPIVICSAAMKRDEVGTTFRALDAGAVAFVDKPQGPGHPDFAKQTAELVATVRSMAGLKPAPRRPRGSEQAAAATHTGRDALTTELRTVVIGASTGGPPALRDLLAGLPADFGLPVLVVQHIAPGFIGGMMDWLANSTPLRLQLATEGTAVLPGTVYFAPDHHHMGLSQFGRIMLDDAAPENGLRPSVARLFRSVLHATGPATAAVLLSGMGRDGADELKLLRDRGALTFAQDRETSVVHGMPGAAIALGAARYILPPPRIAATLALLARKT